MRAAPLLILPLLAAGACILAPDLAKYGYTTCSKDDDCAKEGWLCEQTFCTPPPWWNKDFGVRRQVKFTNTTGVGLTKNFPATFPLGPGKPLYIDEFTPRARLVYLDRTVRAQVELPVSVDKLSGTTANVLFPLPVELPAGGSLPGVWLYMDAAEGVAPRTDGHAQVYTLEDSFEADALDPTAWRTQGAANFAPGDGQVVIGRNGYLWTNESLPPSPGIQLTVLFSVTPYSSCGGISLGLMDNTTYGLKPPYVMVQGDSGNAFLQALSTPTAQFEPAAPAPVALRSSTMRLDLLVSGTKVRAYLDGQTLEDMDLRQAFTKPLHAHFFVEGADCELVVKQVSMRATVTPDLQIELADKVAKPTN